MPKGVMWRHEDLFFGVIGGAGVPRRGIRRLDDPTDIGSWARKGTGVDRRLPLAPLMHGLAQWTALTTLYTGGTLFLDGDRSLRRGPGADHRGRGADPAHPARR